MAMRLVSCSRWWVEHLLLVSGRGSPYIRSVIRHVSHIQATEMTLVVLSAEIMIPSHVVSDLAKFYPVEQGGYAETLLVHRTLSDGTHWRTLVSLRKPLVRSVFSRPKFRSGVNRSPQ